MATTSSETPGPRKAAAPAGKAPGKSATKSTGKSAAKASLKAGGATPGEIIAERYRDTAYEALVGRNGESVSAAMSAGEAVFAGSRLRDDMETAEDFAKAGSPEEFFEKQCSFAKRAAEHYAEETSKLIAMFARIQQSCWAPMEACTKAALNGIGEKDDSGEKE